MNESPGLPSGRNGAFYDRPVAVEPHGPFMSSTAPQVRSACGSIRLLDLVLLVANAVGLLLYLWLASRGWIRPQEHGIIPISGEPIVWALAVPVCVFFFLADVVWGGLLLRCREWRRWLWWLTVGGAWLAAIWIEMGIRLTHHTPTGGVLAGEGEPSG